ncbi:ATP-binding protein [Rariglobus hedericola]|uniref:histidine kinase n=1 Tax=Rariglobus hedericola TaxID=2597822 RepID=A0A556QPM9_9BACT|nr:ATP-binding protein [Rariglobus hedericola]TSJ78596.1 PAS domain S-box protein [Rariglobus hedericola]
MKSDFPDDASLARWRERILTATGFAAERILNSNLEADAFTDALRILGESVEVDRAYVFRFHPGEIEGETLCSQLHEWCRPGVISQIDNPELQNFCFADVGCRRWFEELAANHAISGNVCDFPFEEQPLLLAQTICSLAVMPIFTHGAVWGFIGFDHCERKNVWTEDTLGCLRVAARVFGAAFERCNYKRQSDELAAEYRLLLEDVSEVVFRVDASGYITRLSPAWAGFTGHDPAACLARPMTDFLHPDLKCRWVKNADELIRGVKTVCQDELCFLHADGTSRWALGRAGIRRDNTGATLGFAGTFVDITAMKATEAALIEAHAAAESANQAKSDFIATMSHELRTPLNAVLGLSESLLESGPSFDPEKIRRYMELINRGGRQLLALINDILDLASLDSGRSLPVMTAIHADSLCDAVVVALALSARENKLDLRIEAPADLIFYGDRGLLMQALHNLIHNAIKFTLPGGRIVVAACVRPGGIMISVKDTGAGIPADKFDRLFKPFSQVGASLSRRFSGTGLGLVLVERIARLHRGHVSVESTVGKGSTFTLDLPSASPPQPAPPFQP